MLVSSLFQVLKALQVAFQSYLSFLHKKSGLVGSASRLYQLLLQSVMGTDVNCELMLFFCLSPLHLLAPYFFMLRWK